MSAIHMPRLETLKLHDFIRTCALTVFISAAPAYDEPRVGSPGALHSQREALFKEYVDAYQKWYEARHAAPTDEGVLKFARPDSGAYAARFLAMAVARPNDPSAVECLNSAIVVDPLGDTFPEAVARLRAIYTRSPQVGEALQTIAFSMTAPAVEPLLRAVLKDNPDAAVRGQAALALAEHLRRMANETNHLAANPEAYGRAVSRHGEAIANGIKDRDSDALMRETESLLESVVKQHDDAPFNERQSLGERAAAILHEMNELVVGKAAPEIVGKDVDGKPMRLSDYRGKVVVLVWWATWCGPCMDMISHERELIERLEGKPFVLLGINGDESRERLEYQIKAKGIVWRSWHDGGPDGPISTRWNVRGWPTVYVLDRDGVIRYKGGRDVKQLDEAVAKLLPGG